MREKIYSCKTPFLLYKSSTLHGHASIMQPLLESEYPRSHKSFKVDLIIRYFNPNARKCRHFCSKSCIVGISFRIASLRYRDVPHSVLRIQIFN